MGFSAEARRHAALARKIKARLGQQAYLNFKRTGVVPAGLDLKKPKTARPRKPRKTQAHKPKGGGKFGPQRYVEVKIKGDDASGKPGPERTVLLEVKGEDENILRGIEVRRVGGEPVRPKGADERLHVIDKTTITYQREMRMNLKYAEIEPLEDKRVKPAPASQLRPGTKVISSNSRRPGRILHRKTLKDGSHAYLVRWDDGQGMGLMTPDRLIVVKTKKDAPGKADSTGVGPIYDEMAAKGIKADVEGLDGAISDWQARRDEAQRELDLITGIEGFNPRSLNDVNKYLGSERGPVQSVSEMALVDVLSPAESATFNAMREANKTLQDLQTLRKFTDDDGRVRPEWTEAATGRWYTGHPPIQTLSAEVRRYLVPEEGHAFVTLDWHQHELRVLAVLSQDPDLMKIFEEKQDPHLAVYERVTGRKISTDPAERKEQRDVGKMLNYALVYGLGPESLAQRLEISTEEAQELIDAHFEKFPVMAKWIQSVADKAEKKGYITTIAGRKIPIDTEDMTPRSGRGWRQAVNYTLQGSSADHLADLVKRIKALGPEDFELLKATIHDALLLDVPIEKRRELQELFQKLMEDPFKGIVATTDAKGPSSDWKAAMDDVEMDLPAAA